MHANFFEDELQHIIWTETGFVSWQEVYMYYKAGHCIDTVGVANIILVI